MHCVLSYSIQNKYHFRACALTLLNQTESPTPHKVLRRGMLFKIAL